MTFRFVFYSVILILIEFVLSMFYSGPFHIYLSPAFFTTAALFYKRKEVYPAAFLNGVIFDSFSSYYFGIYTFIFMTIVFLANLIKPQILPRAKPIFAIFLALFFLLVVYGVYSGFHNFDFLIFLRFVPSFLATGLAAFIFAIIFKKNVGEKI